MKFLLTKTNHEMIITALIMYLKVLIYGHIELLFEFDFFSLQTLNAACLRKKEFLDFKFLARNIFRVRGNIKHLNNILQ